MENTKKKMGKLFCVVIMPLVFCVFLSVYGIALAKQDTGMTSGGGWVGPNSPETAQALAIDATGTASSTETQSNSERFSLTGSYWTGLESIDHSYIFQNIASTTEDEKGRLGLSWDTLELLSVLENGNVGIGTTTPGEKLTVDGIIASLSGGIKFPDGTIQTTAAIGLSLMLDDNNKSYYGLGNTSNGDTIGLINISKYMEATGNSNMTLDNLLTGFSNNITSANFPIVSQGSEIDTNTFFGLDSGDSISTGLRNTCYGYRSGFNLRAGSGNVFLGHEAGYYYQAGSNALIIGNSRSNTLIYGAFASKRVGIGTVSPAGKLHLKEGPSSADFIFKTATTPTVPVGGSTLASIITCSGNFHHGFEIPANDPNDGFFVTTDSNSDGTVDTVALKINAAGNVGIGTVNPTAKLEINGTTRTKLLEITGGADLSEQFDINKSINIDGHIAQETLNINPGMIVCIDPENPGKLLINTEAYDKKVAGIISGAGGVETGMMMGQKGSVADGQYPVALTGRVYAYADATKNPIKPGDLLTTSDTPGHAMKVTEYGKAHGAILGKAMSSLDNDKGLVLVLVTLH